MFDFTPQTLAARMIANQNKAISKLAAKVNKAMMNACRYPITVDARGYQMDDVKEVVHRLCLAGFTTEVFSEYEADAYIYIRPPTNV